MTKETGSFTEIFNEDDVRILASNHVTEIQFRIEANVEGVWQFQALAYHLNPAVLLADKLVDFMRAR